MPPCPTRTAAVPNVDRGIGCSPGGTEARVQPDGSFRRHTRQDGRGRMVQPRTRLAFAVAVVLAASVACTNNVQGTGSGAAEAVTEGGTSRDLFGDAVANSVRRWSAGRFVCYCGAGIPASEPGKRHPHFSTAPLSIGAARCAGRAVRQRSFPALRDHRTSQPQRHRLCATRLPRGERVRAPTGCARDQAGDSCSARPDLRAPRPRTPPSPPHAGRDLLLQHRHCHGLWSSAYHFDSTTHPPTR